MDDTLGDSSNDSNFFGDLTDSLSTLSSAAAPVLAALKVGGTASQTAKPNTPTAGSPAASSNVMLYVLGGIAAIIGLVFLLRK
jgi:hypothetical protein